MSTAKIPRDDRRAQYMSGNRVVDAAGLAEFAADKHQWVLSTTRRDGRPQLSLVTGGVLPDGRFITSTYPERVKAANARRNEHTSILVMGGAFNDEWIQVDGDAEVIDMPDAANALVEYYRCISGEHPDWDEYRQAMSDQGKCAIVITPTRWGPVSKGGFPPSLFEDE